MTNDSTPPPFAKEERPDVNASGARMRDGSAERPDVAALMAEIEAAVADKKARGLYDAAEIRRVEEAAVSLRNTPDDEAVVDLALRQAWLVENWDAKLPEIRSHRRGFRGRAVVVLKRLVHRLTRPYINIVLARQTAINDQVVRVLNALIPLRQRSVQMDAVEDLARFLATEHGRRLAEIDARMAALERPLLSGQARLETLLAQLQHFVERQAAEPNSPQGASGVARVRAAARGTAYLAFEDLHRGTREEIKGRQGVYLLHYRDVAHSETPILDLGCGRGEFLELCRDAGLPAYGVDVNPEMVALCRGLNLEAEEADALEHLRARPEASLGGILLSQVIEHLTLDQLTELVALSAQKLAPGGVLIAETINPQSLSTFAGAFYADLSHIRPVHPEAARFLWRWAGLTDVQILYLSPVPPEHRLELLKSTAVSPEVVGAFNRNADRLNQLIYGPLDYAVVGRK